MAFTEDLSYLVDTTTGFAVTATKGAGGTVAGLFDKEYLDVGDVSTSGPAFTCRTADNPGAVGATLTIDSIIYTIRAVEPDGLGVTVLRLERAG